MTRVITLGEIMLRLSAPEGERLLQSPLLQATFGGGEANVAVGLARFGLDVAFVSAVPDNPIGDACLAELLKHGVDTSLVLRQGERLGIYFLEPGVNQRPSKVLYDRAHSAMGLARPDDFDWQRTFAKASWFHITGITPAISASAADLAIAAAKQARQRGLTLSCDLNFRGKLWKHGRAAPEVMGELVKLVDVVMGNEEDCQRALGLDAPMDVESGQLSPVAYQELAQRVLQRYANLSRVALTLRQSHSASHNTWSAVLSNREGFVVSRAYEIRNIVDRVGSGDAFAAGLIYGLIHLDDDQRALELATAASCLKHSIRGDLPLLHLDEVNALVQGSGSGRVQR